LSSISSSGLTKKFGILTAVEGLTFEVEEGEVFGLLGPNGAGKTTTIRMLSCLISSTSGTATVCGFDIKSEAKRVRKVVGVLTESPSLYERLTAAENMDFFAQAYGLSDPAERRRRVKSLLEQLGLWERRGDRVSTFSKGMKQKLAFARAVLHSPKVVFLDEPTTNLDPGSSRQIRAMIEEMSSKEKVTVLLSTHRLEDAERLAQRVMIINRGRPAAIGKPSEIVEGAKGKMLLEVKIRALEPKVLEAVRTAGIPFDIRDEGGRPTILFQDSRPDEVAPGLVRSIVQAGGEILSVTPLRLTLEDAYMSIVGGYKE
jgi:ABC-2 type transport system ATP-binding protein